MIKALYATNVYHYDHVLIAMNAVFDETSLVRRFEIPPSFIERLRSLGLSDKFVSLLNRRVRVPSTIPRSVQSFGLSQMALPAMTRLGVTIRPQHIRSVTSAYAGQVAIAARGNDFLHFVEGLGFRALRKHSFELSICERRNFHHSVFEQELEPCLEFPMNARIDPLRDILEYEYEESDYIMLYSEAAKRSFLDRGFQESRILVSPIGIGPQLPRLSLEREPYRLAYVGRGDIHKGIDVAVAAVKAMGRPYRLTVAGPMAPEVKIWLAGQEHVDYVGILTRDELRDLYSTSAAMVLPSTESYGLAAAEAVYHGLHVVCSNFTGIAEYLPPSSCSIVEGRDADMWASRIFQVLADLGSRTSNSTEVLHELDWDSTAAHLTGIYERLRTEVLARRI